MAYVTNRLSVLQGAIGGLQRLWTYQTADSIATVVGAGYISDATNKRMQIGDLVLVFSGTLNTTGPDQSPSTKSRGVVSEFASDPSVAFCVVDSITTGAATLKEVSVELGASLGFFGATPVAQPSGAGEGAVTVHTITTASTTTSPWGYATSTQADAVAADLKATVTLVNQLRTDLVALGLIKGGA